MQLDCNRIGVQKITRIQISTKNKPDAPTLFENEKKK